MTQPMRSICRVDGERLSDRGSLMDHSRLADSEKSTADSWLCQSAEPLIDQETDTYP